MQLDKLIVHLRPRNAWQAIDLGCRMTLFWYRPLLCIWLSLSLPLFLAIAWFSPLLAIVAVWFFKPLFERALLFFVSRAVFSAPPSIQSCLRAFPAQIKNAWFSSMTWRRIVPTRSFNLAAIQLEQLKGAALKKRLSILHRSINDQSAWWGYICFLWEWIILMGLFAFFGLMTPEGIAEFTIYQLVYSQYWQYTTALLLYISFTLITPFYLTAGFSLYLNRRVELEAWDLELEFKKIAERLAKPIISGLLVMSVCFALPMSIVKPAYANSIMATEVENTANNEKESDESQPVKTLPANLDTYQKLVKAVYKQPPFESIKTQRHLEWVGPTLDYSVDSDDGYKWLEKLLKNLSLYLEIGMWCMFITLIGLMIFYFRTQLFFWRNIKVPTFEQPMPNFIKVDQSQGDLTNSANLKRRFEQALANGDFRLALSLLMHSSLLKVRNQYPVKLSQSMTEGECLAEIKPKVNADLYHYLHLLFNRWIALAWAHQSIEKAQLIELYQQNQTAFLTDTPNSGAQ